MDDLTALELALPKYLSEDKIENLFNQLRDFPNNMGNVYSSYPPDFWMQGDGFKNIDFTYYFNGKYELTTCDSMLISNTCDASTDNTREFYTPQLLFAPIFDLNTYRQALLTKFDIAKVNTHIDAIKKQKITSFFYIPPQHNTEDKFARFDCAFSISLYEISKIKDKMLKNRLFSFSNYGFYVLLFKISIHFTRVLERIDRD